MNRNQRVVPIETARQLLEQRDELAEQVRSLRNEVDDLRHEREGLTQRIEELEGELAAAEKRLEERPASAERARQVTESSKREGDASEGAGDGGEIRQERARSKRLSAKVQELSSDLKRVRQQSDRASTQARRTEKKRLLAGLADLVESIDRGLSMERDEENRQGLRSMERQLEAFLRREDAELIGEVGDGMNPARHEAVDRVEHPDHSPGEIVRVQRRGMVLTGGDGSGEAGDLVFPAKVVVSH